MITLDDISNYEFKSYVEISTKLPTSEDISNLDKYLIYNLIQEKVKVWKTNKEPYK